MPTTLEEDERLELEFLRFFFDEAQHPFGPANGDITQMICEAWVDETGYEVPSGYGYEEDE